MASDAANNGNSGNFQVDEKEETMESVQSSGIVSAPRESKALETVGSSQPKPPLQEPREEGQETKENPKVTSFEGQEMSKEDISGDGPQSMLAPIKPVIDKASDAVITPVIDTESKCDEENPSIENQGATSVSNPTPIEVDNANREAPIEVPSSEPEENKNEIEVEKTALVEPALGEKEDTCDTTEKSSPDSSGADAKELSVDHGVIGKDGHLVREGNEPVVDKADSRIECESSGAVANENKAQEGLETPSQDQASDDAATKEDETKPASDSVKEDSGRTPDLVKDNAANQIQDELKSNVSEDQETKHAGVEKDNKAGEGESEGSAGSTQECLEKSDATVKPQESNENQELTLRESDSSTAVLEDKKENVTEAIVTPDTGADQNMDASSNENKSSNDLVGDEKEQTASDPSTQSKEQERESEQDAGQSESNSAPSVIESTEHLAKQAPEALQNQVKEAEGEPQTEISSAGVEAGETSMETNENEKQEDSLESVCLLEGKTLKEEASKSELQPELPTSNVIGMKRKHDSVDDKGGEGVEDEEPVKKAAIVDIEETCEKIEEDTEPKTNTENKEDEPEVSEVEAAEKTDPVTTEKGQESLKDVDQTDQACPEKMDTTESAVDTLEIATELSDAQSQDGNGAEMSECASVTEQSETASQVANLDENSQMINEDSQAASTKSEKTNKSRRSSCSSAAAEKAEEEEKVHEVTAENLYEYQWPPDKTGEWYMLQEQLSEFLSIKSFKRKYPDLTRRPVEMSERIFLREKGAVSETMCDLGLTAVRSDEVYDLMMKDYPPKYQDYIAVLQERERKKISEKHKNYELATIEKSKIVEHTKKAIRSASEFNRFFNRERKEERRAYFDLQTMEVHYPRSRLKVLPKEATNPGLYPVTIIPGQFQDFYKKYESEELKYLPVNTCLYGPPKALKTIYADPESEDEVSNSDAASDAGSVKSMGSSASGSSSASSASGGSASQDSQTNGQRLDVSVAAANGNSNSASIKSAKVIVDVPSSLSMASAATAAALTPCSVVLPPASPLSSSPVELSAFAQKSVDSIFSFFSANENSLDCDPPGPSFAKPSEVLLEEKKGKTDVADIFEEIRCHICVETEEKDKKKKKKKVPKSEDKSNEELVFCSECKKGSHPSCLELTEVMIPMIKMYAWQCMECKTCVECMDPYDEDKMVFCDRCDRGYHTFCVGLRRVPSGSWECPSCPKDDETTTSTPKPKKSKKK